MSGSGENLVIVDKPEVSHFSIKKELEHNKLEHSTEHCRKRSVHGDVEGIFISHSEIKQEPDDQLASSLSEYEPDLLAVCKDELKIFKENATFTNDIKEKINVTELVEQKYLSLGDTPDRIYIIKSEVDTDSLSIASVDKDSLQPKTSNTVNQEKSESGDIKKVEREIICQVALEQQKGWKTHQSEETLYKLKKRKLACERQRRWRARQSQETLHKLRQENAERQRLHRFCKSYNVKIINLSSPCIAQVQQENQLPLQGSQKRNLHDVRHGNRERQHTRRAHQHEKVINTKMFDYHNTEYYAEENMSETIEEINFPHVECKQEPDDQSVCSFEEHAPDPLGICNEQFENTEEEDAFVRNIDQEICKTEPVEQKYLPVPLHTIYIPELKIESEIASVDEYGVQRSTSGYQKKDMSRSANIKETEKERKRRLARIRQQRYKARRRQEVLDKVILTKEETLLETERNRRMTRERVRRYRERQKLITEELNATVKLLLQQNKKSSETSDEYTEDDPR